MRFSVSRQSIVSRSTGFVLLAVSMSTLIGCATGHKSSPAEASAAGTPREGTVGVTPVSTQPGMVGPSATFPAATPERVIAVTRQVFPAVVRLDVAQAVYNSGKRTLQRGIGSGVIIDDDGHILTNFHVAGRAAEIYVTLYNKERVPAKLIGEDHWTDLAVVQLDLDEIKKRKVEFKHAELGDSSSLQVGQDVIAIGTPFGLARTMTLGIVSNNERTFYPDQQTIDDYETGNFGNWIQMDTPIAPGNSGGPLVDLNSRVVGINTRGFKNQNLNFAIPIDQAKRVIGEILRTATDGAKGHVDRADLGIDLKPMQDLETYYEIDINRGVLVNSVDRNSPAAKAGIKPQDIILSIGGQATNVRFPEEIAPTRQMIADLQIDAPVKVDLLRNGRPMSMDLTTVKLQSAIGDEQEAKAWGMSVRDVTRAYANSRQLDDDEGVVITSLTNGYAGDKADLRGGDIIRNVNGKPVADLEAFMKIFNESKEKKEAKVLLKIQRDRGLIDALLRVNY